LLALLGAHHIFQVSGLRVKALDSICPYFSKIIVSLNTCRNIPKYRGLSFSQQYWTNVLGYDVL
jgi:hypothetical protein